MSYAKNFLMVAGTVALVVILGGLLAPKTAHAFVAALVQITNTVSNPVQTEEALGGATVLEAQCQASSSSAGGFFTSAPCFAVPAGKRAVVEFVDAACRAPFGTPPRAVFLLLGDGVSHPLALQFVGEEYAVNVPLRLYADAGSQFTLTGVTNDVTGDTHCMANITGRLVPTN